MSQDTPMAPFRPADRANSPLKRIGQLLDTDDPMPYCHYTSIALSPGYCRNCSLFICESIYGLDLSVSLSD